MPSKSEEPRAKYYTHNPNAKFWTFKRYPKMKFNNQQCRTCIYRSKVSDGHRPLWGVGCDYILFEGHRRDCPPSPHCEKYVKGKRKVRENLFNPHGRNGFSSPYEPSFVELGDGYST